jgi:TonB family protein
MKRLLIAFALVASSLCAQDWAPTRIVAITSYLPLAKMARASGDVIVKCLLNKDGSVASAEVISSHVLLKEQARANALLWKFQRTAPGGVTSDNSVTLTYQYRLDGERPDDRLTSFSVELPNTVHIIAPLPVPMIN